MSLKYWGDPVSQPSRTVEFVLRKLGLDYENNFIELFKATRTEEFKRDVNPRGLVPVLEHDGHKMFESATICRYLLDTFEGDEHLLPRKDLKARSDVDALLDWNGSTVRPNFTGPLRKLVLFPLVFGDPAPTEEERKEEMQKVHSVLDELEELTGKHQFLTGEHMSIADVHIFNELILCKTVIGFDLDKYPNTQKWADRVQEDPIVQALVEEMNKRISSMQ